MTNEAPSFEPFKIIQGWNSQRKTGTYTYISFVWKIIDDVEENFYYEISHITKFIDNLKVIK